MAMGMPRWEGPGWVLPTPSCSLPHRNSSSPSLQSETPSHRAVSSMHLKDERHLYFPEQSKWTEDREAGRRVSKQLRQCTALSTVHLPRGADLPINNETSLEIASSSLACFLRTSFCAEFQRVGLPHPTVSLCVAWPWKQN